MKWNDLSMKDRATLIQLGVASGVYDIGTIRDTYNEFAKGGDTGNNWNLEDEAGYNEWLEGLPDNLRYTNEREYNMREAYKTGMQPHLEDDGLYHFSTRNPFTGDYMKAPQHRTTLKGLMEDALIGYYPVRNPNGKYQGRINTDTWEGNKGNDKYPRLVEKRFANGGPYSGEDEPTGYMGTAEDYGDVVNINLPELTIRQPQLITGNEQLPYFDSYYDHLPMLFSKPDFNDVDLSEFLNSNLYTTPIKKKKVFGGPLVERAHKYYEGGDTQQEAINKIIEWSQTDPNTGERNPFYSREYDTYGTVELPEVDITEHWTPQGLRNVAAREGRQYMYDAMNQGYDVVGPLLTTLVSAPMDFYPMETLLSGLSKAQKAKVPVSNFKSELDWSPEGWFGKYRPGGKYDAEDVAALKSHVPEYIEIERKAKVDGTWMRDADGKMKEMDPREWVIRQSEDYKKAGLTGTKHYNGVSGINALNYEYNGDAWTDLEKSVSQYFKDAYNTYNRPGVLLQLDYPANTPIAVLDAQGRNWYDLPESAFLEPNTPREFMGSDTAVSQAVRKGYGATRINNIIEGNGKKVTDVVIHAGTPRKSVLGNNGNFDLNNKNIYKGLLPFALGLELTGGHLFGPGGSLDQELKQVTQNQQQNKFDWRQALKDAGTVALFGPLGSLIPLLRMNKNNENQSNKTVVQKEDTPVEFDWNDLRQRQAWTESKNDAKAVSPRGAKGVFQIMDATLQDYQKKTGDIGDIFDPEYNGKVRDYYLNWLMERPVVNTNNPPDSIQAAKAMAAYNWGVGNLTDYLIDQKKQGNDIYMSLDWVEGLPKETRDYVNFIVRHRDSGGHRTNNRYKKAFNIE